MKLIAAQISSTVGNIEKNLGKHVDIIHQAANLSADGIFFRSFPSVVMSQA